MCFGAGLLGATAFVAHHRASRQASAEGACLAMEMAAAHGAIDEARMRRISRAMTDGINASHARLPVSYGELIAACERLRQSR